MLKKKSSQKWQLSILLSKIIFLIVLEKWMVYCVLSYSVGLNLCDLMNCTR